MLNTRPVSSKSAFGAAPKILSSKIELISAPRLPHVKCSFLAAVAGMALATWSQIGKIVDYKTQAS